MTSSNQSYLQFIIQISGYSNNHSIVFLRRLYQKYFSQKTLFSHVCKFTDLFFISKGNASRNAKRLIHLEIQSSTSNQKTATTSPCLDLNTCFIWKVSSTVLSSLYIYQQWKRMSTIFIVLILFTWFYITSLLTLRLCLRLPLPFFSS